MLYFVLFTLSASAFLESFLVSSGGRSLPKNFLRCSRSDPDLNGCLEKAVTDAFRKMKSAGVPSLGLFPLEPLQIDDIKLDSGNRDAPVNMKLQFKNMKMYGIGDTTLSNYKADLKNTNLRAVAYSPRITFDADYEADGRVLLLPIKGRGQSNITMVDMNTITELTFKPEEKDGETYWIIQNFSNRFEPKRMTVQFSGLLNGDRTLNEGINNFINQNWQPVFEGLRPEFEAAFGAIFKEITSRVFGKVPINKIFTD